MYIGEVISFIAGLMLLLISISTPVVKNLYVFSLTSRSPGSILIKGVNHTTNGIVHFGGYGYCVPFTSNGNLSAIHCSSAELGHTFNTEVQDALGVRGIQDVYNSHTSRAMILNPITCILVFMDGISDSEYLSPLIILLTTATLLFDIISVSVMRNKVESITGGLVSISLGPCTWLAVCAFTMIWAFSIAYVVVNLFFESRDEVIRRNNVEIGTV